MKLRCVVAISVTAVITAASGVHAQQDRRNAKQIADSTEIASLAREITAKASTDSARASALYQWVATNIRYDAESFLKGRITDDHAEFVYRNRIGVCAGYVALYTRMATEAGVETKSIKGYAKGYGYASGQGTKKANHAWVGVRLENGWKLVDPTWGAGVLRDGKFEATFIWDYFMADPEALVLSHFPEEDEWQLVRSPLERRQFERMPAVPRTMLSIGFDPATLRRTALTPGVSEFPLIGKQMDRVRIVKAPAAGVLKNTEPVEIEVLWPGVVDVMLVNGDKWTPLSRDGERFQGNITAGPGTVSVVGRRSPEAAYETLLYYQVR